MLYIFSVYSSNRHRSKLTIVLSGKKRRLSKMMDKKFEAMTAALSATMVDRDEKYNSMLAKVTKMDGILVNQAAIIKRQDN